MRLELKIFQHGLDTVNMGISREDVTVAPGIDPNGIHTGIQGAGDIAIGIIAHKDTLLIGDAQELGGMIEHTAVRLVDTYLTGQNDGVE